MIKAWVLYYDGKVHHFEELDGSSYSDVSPEAWGLSATASVLLVLQQAQYIDAWLYGERIERAFS